MSDRETRDITTPGGKILVIKSYITPREANAIREILIKGASVDLNDMDAKIDKVPAENLVAFSNAMLKDVVVSYDGKTENILDVLLDLKDLKEFNFILVEAKAVYSGNLTKEK